MDKFSNIEAELERLILPRGLSDDFNQELTGVIDDLATNTDLSGCSVFRRFSMSRQAQALAAALVLSLVALGIWVGTNNHSSPISLALNEGLQSGGIAVLESSVWIDSGEDLGIQSMNEFGEARRGWSYVGVEEERFLHEDTGYEVILQREFESQHYATTSL